MALDLLKVEPHRVKAGVQGKNVFCSMVDQKQEKQ